MLLLLVPGGGRRISMGGLPAAACVRFHRFAAVRRSLLWSSGSAQPEHRSPLPSASLLSPRHDRAYSGSDGCRRPPAPPPLITSESAVTPAMRGSSNRVRRGQPSLSDPVSGHAGRSAADSPLHPHPVNRHRPLIE